MEKFLPLLFSFFLVGAIPIIPPTVPADPVRTLPFRFELTVPRNYNTVCGKNFNKNVTLVEREEGTLQTMSIWTTVNNRIPTPNASLSNFVNYNSNNGVR